MGVATFVAAPYFKIWLPRDVSAHGHAIDHLFFFILALVAILCLLILKRLRKLEHATATAAEKGTAP